MKNKGTSANTLGCHLFFWASVHAQWAGVRISLVQREVVFESFSHSHITLYSEAEFVGVRGFGRRIFSQQKGREREFRVTGGAKMRASRVKANVKDSQCQVCVRTLVRVRFVCECVWLPYSHNRPVVNLKTLKSSCFLLHLLLLTPYFLASYFSLALRHYA